jgi:hypothetical protein
MGAVLLDRTQKNWDIDPMKTTLDLPKHPVTEVASVMSHHEVTLPSRRGEIAGRRVKLPLIECRASAELTPKDVAGVLLKQEVEWGSAECG